ncbi:formylglycine-generating enzyme family protein [Phenylobacterium sp. VNQ135]|uniref:formylglycine-generating enzyme family protein n=1 Tax=Phenylobacterium sp. VNQ135 TaxID=3400922 RepID=UPI003C04495C
MSTRPPIRAVVAALVSACGLYACAKPPGEAPPAACPAAPAGEVALPGGRFVMGADPLRPEEGPPREVTVGPFSIDRTEVTNAQFAAFVEATGYVTLAERRPDPKFYPGVDPSRLKPSSIVFVGDVADPSRSDPSRWWRVVEGADWRHPLGPGSSIAGREQLPVVHVGFEDALAYARWRGRDLPTEAEWEYAARGGLTEARYPWGDEPSTAAAPRANHWQGPFPALDSGADGYKMTPAPVGCFAPNGHGLYDMAGNVWEWTRDWYRPGLVAEGADPSGPDQAQAFDPAEPQTPKHVIKGGSYLCADDYCFRYRPGARQPGPPDTGASHLGFRTVKRATHAPDAMRRPA